MKQFYTALCLVAINSIGSVINAQEISGDRNKQTRPSNEVKTNVEVSKKTSRPSIIFAGVSPKQYVHTLAEKVSQMQDIRASSYQLARIADLIWKRDEVYAREVFAKSLEKVNFSETDSEQEATLKNEIRRRILSLIAKRDVNWSEKLIDAIAAKTKAQSESCQNGEPNLDVALDLVEEHPKLATNFAERSLQNGISANFITFLQKLRQENRNAADGLFLQILTKYAQQSNPDAYQLLVLGTYLFKSPLAGNKEVTAFTLTRFGNVGIPNITANQQGISQTLVRAYLTTAIVTMRRPSSDSTQQQYKYALGSLLLPKAQEFAPDLIGVIGAATAALSSSVPNELTQDEAFANLKRTSLSTPAERLEKIEKMADQNSRDANYLDVTFQAWSKGNFVTARAAAAKISDEETESTLRVLIDFGEATALLKQRQPNLMEAERLAARLPQNIERTLLHLEIASAAVKTKNTLSAFENLQAAAKSARQVSDARRPYLLLAIAAGFAAFDFIQANLILNEAVQALNQSEKSGETTVKWETPVTIEPLTLRFPLAAGTKLYFENSVQKIVPVIETEMPFEAIKSEQLRAKAFVVLAKFALDSEESANSQNDETVVTVGEDGIRRSAAKTVMPIYPEDARKKGIKGVAVVELQYNGKGDVTNTRILQSPDSATGKAVVDAVKQWKFKPSKLEGKPISVRGKLTFYFVLNTNGNTEVRNPKQYQ